MVSNQLHATYTETYDLNTAVGELSILGIHTPQAGAVKKMFKGLFENYKKYKVLGCNLQMVCASQQSLTPDLVGQEEGQVDPRDILNPILFKACTGEGLNDLLDQVYNGAEEIQTSTYGNSGCSIAQHVDSRQIAIDSYYQMLADDSFRKEHPQRGLTVMGLRPFVHKVVTTQPFKWSGSAGNNYGWSSPAIQGTSSPTGSGSSLGFAGPSGSKGAQQAGEPSGQTDYRTSNRSVFVSDGITDMPWLETTVKKGMLQYDNQVEGYAKDVYGYGTIEDIPRVYCGCIILPPAINQRLFFRMTIAWHILFKDFRPAYEVGPIETSKNVFNDDYSGMAGDDGNTTYFNIYHNPTPTRLLNECSSFTTTEGTEVETINERVA